MFETSSEFKEAIKKKSRNWRLKIWVYFNNGETPLLLTNDDIVLGSFSYDEASICSDTLDIGATYTNGVEFSLINYDKKFSNMNFANARLDVSVGLQIQYDVWEDIPMGIFFVTDVGKKLSTIPVKALDRMYLMNESVSKIQILPNSTLHDIFTTLSTHFSFTIENATSVLIDSIKEETDNDENHYLKISGLNEKISCRDFVGYSAAIFGMSARFNREGKLEFYKISDTVYETDSNIRTDLSLSDFEVCPTGVSVTDADENTYYQGTDSYLLSVDANPLLLNEDITAFACDNTYKSLVGIAYSPYTCKVIGDPSIQCGDRIRHLEKTAPNINSVITGFKFTFRGISTLEAKGKQPQSETQLSATAKKLISIREKNDKTLENLNSLEQVIVKQNDLMSQSMGFYQYSEYDTDGKLTAYYLMDTNDKNTAKLVWKITLQGIAVSTSGINGPFTSGWTADETFVAKIVAASTVITDYLLSSDNKIKINLSDGKFEATTNLGTCEIQGNQITVNYQDTDSHKDISFLQVTADSEQSDSTVDMKILLSSHDGIVSSSIVQQFDYDENGNTTEKKPLTISSTESIMLNKDISVLDSILYDNIKMQRKSSEYKNTGVDFVLSPKPFVTPVNLLEGNNPGFEYGILYPWTASGSGGGSTQYITNTQKHSGSYSCCSDYNMQTNLRFPITTPNENIYIGFYAYAVGAPTLYSYVYLLIDGAVVSSIPLDQAGWMYCSDIISCTAGQTIDLRYNSSIGYFDDFFVFKSTGYFKEQFDEYVQNLF